MGLLLVAIFTNSVLFVYLIAQQTERGKCSTKFYYLVQGVKTLMAFVSCPLSCQV